MYRIDNKKFGEFVAQLRKEKNLTQKELAERLFISDKTVSKWERGLSIPDVSLLIPIADVLGVTVTELLYGERLGRERSLGIEEVEGLVTCSMDMSKQERSVQKKRRLRWVLLYIAAVSVVALETVLLMLNGFMELEGLYLVEGLMLVFGGWFCLFAKETLPTYYDENKVHYISDGFFRMDMPGMHFNNSNWPHILKAGRIWTLMVAVLWPLLDGGVRIFLGEEVWQVAQWIAVMIVSFSIFIPVYVMGKKYE